jgi:hypothetical protein
MSTSNTSLTNNWPGRIYLFLGGGGLAEGKPHPSQEQANQACIATCVFPTLAIVLIAFAGERRQR